MAENLIGERFGRLLVIQVAGRNKYGQIKWLCKCDCGNTKAVFGSDLKRGKVKSCGCLRKRLEIADVSDEYSKFPTGDYLMKYAQTKQTEQAAQAFWHKVMTEPNGRMLHRKRCPNYQKGLCIKDSEIGYCNAEVSPCRRMELYDEREPATAMG